MDEVKELIIVVNDKIKDENVGGEMKVHQIFNLPVVNALWKIIAGKRLDMNDPKEKNKNADLAAMFASFGVTGIVFPIAVQLPFALATRIPLLKRTKDLFQSLNSWYREEYAEHEKDWDPDNFRDYLDVYIAERKNANTENDTESSFYGDMGMGDYNFVVSMFDLFLAGSESTSTTLTWAILFMLHNPEPFKKAQAELDQVVGRSRLPNLEDKAQLPYFEALLAEIMRCADAAPFGVPRTVHKEAHIDSYTYCTAFFEKNKF
jgi:cytochrome P450